MGDGVSHVSLPADRWEFAHVSFLRGQAHLLSRIVRRSGGGEKRKDEAAGAGGGEAGDVDEESAMVAMEVARLRQEQREIEDRVAAMWRRVQETERRPKQMLAFLVKVVGDLQVLRRLVDRDAPAAEADRARGEVKRVRLLLDTTTDDHLVTTAGDVGRRVDGFYAGCGAVDADAFVPDDTIDFTGLYTGGAGFGNVIDAAAVVDSAYPPAYAFPVDRGY